MTSYPGELVPIVMFLAIAAVVIAVAYFRMQKEKALAGGGDYRRLAEEVAEGQKAFLEEVRTMNATLKEIERLLKEV